MMEMRSSRASHLFLIVIPGMGAVILWSLSRRYELVEKVVISVGVGGPSLVVFLLIIGGGFIAIGGDDADGRAKRGPLIAGWCISGILASSSGLLVHKIDLWPWLKTGFLLIGCFISPLGIILVPTLLSSLLDQVDHSSNKQHAHTSRSRSLKGMVLSGVAVGTFLALAMWVQSEEWQLICAMGAGVPLALFFYCLTGLVTGKSFEELRQRWDELKGWQRGVLGTVIVLIGGITMLSVVGLAGAFLSWVGVFLGKIDSKRSKMEDVLLVVLISSMVLRRDE
jgi:hypothetical protein